MLSSVHKLVKVVRSCRLPLLCQIRSNKDHDGDRGVRKLLKNADGHVMLTSLQAEYKNTGCLLRSTTPSSFSVGSSDASP